MAFRSFNLTLLLAAASIAACSPVSQEQAVRAQQATSQAEQNAAPGVRATYNVDVTELVEKLRDLIRNGNETLGVPVLDPFTEAGPVGGNFSHGDLRVRGNLSDLEVSGLAAVDVALAVQTGGATIPTVLTLLLEATIPLIKGTAIFEYSAVNQVAGFATSGFGPTELTLPNITVSVDATIKTLTVTNELTVNVNAGDIQVVVSSNDLLSKELTAELNEFFREQKTHIENKIKELLIPIFESVLENYDVIEEICRLVHIPIVCLDKVK